MTQHSLPSVEAWSVFIADLERLAIKRGAMIGEHATAEVVVDPLIALHRLVAAYRPSLLAGIAPLLLAVNESLDGRPPGIFAASSRGGHPKTDDAAMTEGLACAAVQLLLAAKESDGGSPTTSRISVEDAADLVFSAILAGKRPRPSRFTRSTVKGWFFRMKKAHLLEITHGTTKSQSRMANNVYVAAIKTEDPEARLQEVLDWLRQGN